MRKFLGLLLVFMLIATPAFAQARGALPNVYASWVSVTNQALTTITFPANSRDILIENGSAVDVCVNLKGESFEQNCYQSVDSTLHKTMQLGAGDSFFAMDFVTSAITLRSAAATASPVSVVVTW